MVERISELLRQGITAARAGDREQARALLMRVVEEDERNERAWLWLAGVTDDPEDVRTYLHNVLDLNPGNQQARQGLAWIDTRYGRPTPPPEPSREESLPTPAPQIERAVVSPAAEPAPPARSSLLTGSSYTSSTAQFASEGVLNTVARAHASSTPPAEPIAAPPEHPCLYCGAPTVLKQRACTQCRGDLMVRAAPDAARSLPLTILGVLWLINGALAIIGGLLGALGMLFTAQQSQSVIQRVNPQAGSPSTIDMFIPAALGLLFGVGVIQVARALLRRERWAYYVVIALSALGLGGILLGITQVGAMAQSAANSRVLEQIAVAAWVVLFIAAIFQIASLVLVILSYRDFFGPLVRFQPAVEPAEHHQHYNNGVTYKDRGMWYMAAREWKAAASKKPRESNYLHALGLAYAQLKQYDKARTTLDRALQTAPDNQQIKESRVLVDQMAAKT